MESTDSGYRLAVRRRDTLAVFAVNVVAIFSRRDIHVHTLAVRASVLRENTSEHFFKLTSLFASGIGHSNLTLGARWDVYDARLNAR